MSRARSVLIVAAFLASTAAAGEDGPEARLLFTGDILLSRQVRREIEQTKHSPWDGFGTLFSRSDWVMGNLEGAVGGSDDCRPPAAASPCFDIAPGLIPLLSRAGFGALGLENNHSRDLGQVGLATTREALRAANLGAITFEESPAFFSAGGHTIAVIAVSTVPARDGSHDEIPSTAIRQKLRLAKNLSELVIVSVHWGSELLDWPNTRQHEMAAWLVRNGAGLVVGHHPHVVQPAECIAGRPVFFSLGNHVFDQKYPASKQGMIADCRIREGALRCSGIGTETPPGSSFPRVASQVPDTDALQACRIALAASPQVSGVTLRARAAEDDSPGAYAIEGWRAGRREWRSTPLPLVSAEVGRLAGSHGGQYALTLERHPSSIDGEDGVRPYVYEVGPRGLVARWRGSALAWPLLDAELMPEGDGLVCALHRRDSFVVLRPGSEGVRTAVYRWNGFGFSGVDDPELTARCRATFGADE